MTHTKRNQGKKRQRKPNDGYSPTVKR